MKKNTITMSKRCFVRIISFSAAFILALGALAAQHKSRADNSALMLQNNYMRAVEDLSLSLDNIKTTLNKGMYSNSAVMMTGLSSKLTNEAANAKAALAQLPMNELNLEQTYKFLSQVGNYSQSLAKKIESGEMLTSEEKENIRTLYSYADGISQKMWQVEKRIEDGNISFSDIDSAKDTGAAVSVTEGFTDFEEGFSNYPTLIYDGPFSDHILEKEPVMTKNQAEITAEQALEKAQQASGLRELTDGGEEAGKMPSYVFSGENATVAVTKQGGFLSYMLKYRPVGEASISVSEALQKAKSYLSDLGINDLTETYYEVENGECIYNFAAAQGNTTLYTDLIKVAVAMDNGEILSIDARGYITNHTQRELGAPQITREEAAVKLSDSLDIVDSKLCVIPSEGLKERYCYEFYCRTDEGAHVLVYINADTGEEEQILLLQIGENGRLTV
ncbi:MAG: germination protein YpeB [Firmicutes bacterium]|nr:germination protein YpeB [[Eubacterium] siraeum]MCM1488107.1 germination protein YpeB [Bacillota bacterium]